MKIHSLAQLPRKPWKNGQGMTTELAIEPPGANFSEEKFQWRISCAEVKGSNDFSQFKGYTRSLTVWKGDGILLNGKKLEAFVPYQFSGEEKIYCELIKSEIIDLGVIYRKDAFQCEMTVLSGNKDELKNLSLTVDQKNFLFVAEGLVQIRETVLKIGDFAEIDIKSKTEIKFLSKSQLVLINIVKSLP